MTAATVGTMTVRRRTSSSTSDEYGQLALTPCTQQFGTAKELKSTHSSGSDADIDDDDEAGEEDDADRSGAEGALAAPADRADDADDEKTGP